MTMQDEVSEALCKLHFACPSKCAGMQNSQTYMAGKGKLRGLCERESFISKEHMRLEVDDACLSGVGECTCQWRQFLRYLVGGTKFDETKVFDKVVETAAGSAPSLTLVNAVMDIHIHGISPYD
eukprot:2386038-Amphidinium_carterae.1